ncbi:MAG: aminotransferase class I/II-fold pyridoxal phosphate-dependent enzyme [Acidobacteria bacterium]|nr:aminotransferase class I/II-fold pyridoxal phosphate-dependent enzyme [Acidobacteriota bacterium]
MSAKPTRGRQTQATQTYTDGERKQRPLSIPIFQAVNFEAESSRRLGEDFRKRDEHVYLRFGHPTTKAAGDKIALLEGAEAGLVFGSGMGAVSTTLMALAGKAGGHVVAQRQIFGQTFTFLDQTLRSLGMETTFVEGTDLDEWRSAFRPNTVLAYIETPSNPVIKVIDIAAVSAIAREHRVPLVVDSTFASPVLQNPIELGASLVLHSATKFLAGHSDVMCGAAAGSQELIARIHQMQELLGTVLDPHAAWLLLRGIKTLGVRVLRQSESALEIARRLESSPDVAAVHYPLLESSPYYATASRQMRGGGGVLSFVARGGIQSARRFVDALELIPTATSLGGVESVVEIPADLDWSEEELGAVAAAETGIPPGLIRLSVGIEDLDDLLADVDRGLQALRAGAKSAA